MKNILKAVFALGAMFIMGSVSAQTAAPASKGTTSEKPAPTTSEKPMPAKSEVKPATQTATPAPAPATAPQEDKKKESSKGGATTTQPAAGSKMAINEKGTAKDKDNKKAMPKKPVIKNSTSDK